MAAQYTAYIKDLVDYNGNIIYPRTKVEAIYDNDGNVLSIPKNFIINVTEGSEGNFTADKTYAEILEAYNMGHTLYVVLESYRLPLIGFSSVPKESFVFVLTSASMMIGVFIANDVIDVSMYDLEPVPAASSADAGKVLMVGNDGNAAWTTIINAEEVAY